MAQQPAADTIDAGRHSRMNGATLKTVREALGLSASWFADFCAVQERTVRHWESGRNTVPIKVGEAILTLERASQELSDSIVSQVRAITATHGKPDGSVPIVRYADDQDLARCQPNMKGLPATFHAAAIARARWELAGEVEIMAQMFEYELFDVKETYTGIWEGRLRFFDSSGIEISKESTTIGGRTTETSLRKDAKKLGKQLTQEWTERELSQRQ